MVSRRRPDRLRDRLRIRLGSRQVLDAYDARVSVMGTRGKSGLVERLARVFHGRGLSTYAKVTGTDPVSYKDGVGHPIPRGEGAVHLDETLWELAHFAPADVAIVENQAIGPYTMRVFNRRFLDPDVVLVTNLRRDHQPELGDDLESIARANGQAASPGSQVFCGEPRAEAREPFLEEAREAGATAVDASPAGGISVPGREVLPLIDHALTHLYGRGLTHAERSQLERELRETFRWRESSREGLVWFHGAEMNDVDSTAETLDYLQRDQARPVTFVAYLRKDRRARTRAFRGFLQDALDAGEAEKVYLAGHGAQALARRLEAPEDLVEVVPDEPDRVPQLVDRIQAESRSGRVMTVANAVPPFPRRLADELEAGAQPDPAPPSSG